MDLAGLRKLSAAVEYLMDQESFSCTVNRLKDELVHSTENFVWATVDLDSIPCEMPAVIESCWIFYLRRDVPSGSHYHPNSIQHMILIAGHGTSNIDGERRPMVPLTSPEHSLADKCLIIDQGVPHEFTPERDDMIVVSFHTCSASELEEIDCETGGARHYARPDA